MSLRQAARRAQRSRSTHREEGPARVLDAASVLATWPVGTSGPCAACERWPSRQCCVPCSRGADQVWRAGRAEAWRRHFSCEGCSAPRRVVMVIHPKQCWKEGLGHQLLYPPMPQVVEARHDCGVVRASQQQQIKKKKRRSRKRKTFKGLQKEVEATLEAQMYISEFNEREKKKRASPSISVLLTWR